MSQTRRSAAPKQIFASRFDAAANTWVPEGQDRGSGVPSLNIHTDKEAENPSVAGGAAVPGNDPVPWVAWQEQDGNVSGSGNHDQIFVSKGVKQSAPKHPVLRLQALERTQRERVLLAAGRPRPPRPRTAGRPATGDPTLNVDPSRNGIEPDIAFTGANDKVAWVVWYETDSSSLGLRDNEQVFAAKIVADSAADGGFHWQAVGSGTAGQTNVLDTSGSRLRSVRRVDGRRGRVLAEREPEQRRRRSARGGGHADSGSPDGAVGRVGRGHSATASTGSSSRRLVGGDHFELFNGGAPVSNIQP